MDFRIRIAQTCLALVAVLLVGRLFFWQVARGQELSSIARSQVLRSEEINSKRGSVLASDGQPLVASRLSWTVWAQPPKFEKTPGEIADIVANILIQNEADKIRESSDPNTKSEILKLYQNEKERIYKLITRENAQWVLLREKVPIDIKEKIIALDLKGIGFDEDEVRMYPEGTMAASLIGFVGKNKEGKDQGYFGLEGFYNMSLSGKAGYRKEERDARGNPIPFGNVSETLPVQGANLVTHIDRTVQFMIEKVLEEGVQKYGAQYGTVIVAKPTGEIIGMASYPAYDPENYTKYSSEQFKNPAIANTYEPGSIFKVIVMASALDAGVIEPETKCDETCNGPILIDKYAIKTFDGKYYQDTTMKDVIVHSDNTGMVFTARKLGLDKLWEYLENFGIGQSTGIDLQEETVVSLRDKKDWSEVDLATASFGQGLALNSMQYVRALAAIASGGVLPQMQIVSKLVRVSSEGEVSWEQEIKRKPGFRVISQEAAKKMTEMMMAAVDEGEGVVKLAKPQGFKVAGKSGTAQISVDGKYSNERTVASYAGFAPADNPRFVMLVTLREPTANPWGANTAAPMWFKIASDLFPYFGIQPSQ